MLAERTGGEVRQVSSDKRVDPSCNRRGHVRVVVRVFAGHLGDEVRVVLSRYPTVGEELTDGRCYGRRSFRAPMMLADDDAFPFIKQFVGPEDLMDAVLGEREQQVHRRERKEDAGVDKDTPHRSVRKARVGERFADAAATFAPRVTPRVKCQYVSQTDAAVSTTRQAF